jgi:hypothetical protein
MDKRKRLNLSPPPVGAVYYDSNMLMCSPCQFGSVNVCRKLEPTPPPTDGSSLDWIFNSARNAATVARMGEELPCCTTDVDAYGKQVTTCDVNRGCGWAPLQRGSSSVPQCSYVNQGAQYATYSACAADYPPQPITVGANTVEYYGPCEPGQTEECYFPNMDSCLPSVFPAAKAAKAVAQAPVGFVCQGSGEVDSRGNRVFAAGQCFRIMS